MAPQSCHNGVAQTKPVLFKRTRTAPLSAFKRNRKHSKPLSGIISKQAASAQRTRPQTSPQLLSQLMLQFASSVERQNSLNSSETISASSDELRSSTAGASSSSDISAEQRLRAAMHRRLRLIRDMQKQKLPSELLTQQVSQSTSQQSSDNDCASVRIQAQPGCASSALATSPAVSRTAQAATQKQREAHKAQTPLETVTGAVQALLESAAAELGDLLADRLKCQFLSRLFAAAAEAQAAGREFSVAAKMQQMLPALAYAVQQARLQQQLAAAPSSRLVPAATAAPSSNSTHDNDATVAPAMEPAWQLRAVLNLLSGLQQDPSLARTVGSNGSSNLSWVTSGL